MISTLVLAVPRIALDQWNNYIGGVNADKKSLAVYSATTCGSFGAISAALFSFMSTDKCSALFQNLVNIMKFQNSSNPQDVVDYRLQILPEMANNALGCLSQVGVIVLASTALSRVAGKLMTDITAANSKDLGLGDKPVTWKQVAQLTLIETAGWGALGAIGYLGFRGYIR